MSGPQTIRALLNSGAGNAPAILAPGRPALSFSALRTIIDHSSGTLGALGIGPGDRVAIVLPNGPEMAASFIAITCHATVAPLNPAYTGEEFEFYLSDLNAKALVVERGSASAAVDAAQQLGILVIELTADAASPAGTFRLELADSANFPPQDSVATQIPVAPKAANDANPQSTAPTRRAEPDDIALILHTSGTTSRPKIVPLSHRNLCASARNIAATLNLGAGDLCLNIMPLFHIHGLMAALVASLSTGGAAYTAPGFDALRFFTWLEEAHPTWYTAVPAMHQAILSRASRNRAAIGQARLRFIRSASSPLPSQVLGELEAVFGVPVIEAYAMTEAAHQVTSNPLPPGRRIAGTVGLAAGPEVAIMDEAGDTLLGPGEPGEAVIRGENVMIGYENNPQANAAAFARGWFRTGDQAVMDNQGYVTITGRLKEIINRGGEKISPREVDEVLMDHPAVSQAVTFAVPHRSLGEDVAAAVVLRPGTPAQQDDIRGFAATRLAAFKVPRQVLLVDEIPKGATGKLQRIGLAAKLGLA